MEVERDGSQEHVVEVEKDGSQQHVVEVEGRPWSRSHARSRKTGVIQVTLQQEKCSTSLQQLPCLSEEVELLEGELDSETRASTSAADETSENSSGKNEESEKRRGKKVKPRPFILNFIVLVCGRPHVFVCGCSYHSILLRCQLHTARSCTSTREAACFSRISARTAARWWS